MSKATATRREDAPRRHSGTVLLAGLAVSILAAVAPGAILDGRADGRLRAETRALSGAISTDISRSVRRLTAIGSGLDGVPFDPADAVALFASSLPSSRNTSTAAVPFGMLVTQVALVGNVGLLPGGSVAADDVGVSQLVRVNGSGPPTHLRLSVGRSVIEALTTLRLPRAPAADALPRLIAFPGTHLADVWVAGTIEASDGTVTSQAADGWAMAVPVRGVGWLIAPLQPRAVEGLLARRSQGDALGIELRVNGTGLIARVDPRRATASSRRTTTRIDVLGTPITVQVTAPRRFGTSTGPSPLLLFLGGLIVSGVLAALVARRESRLITAGLAAALAVSERIARTDQLTGLGNRRSMDETVARALQTPDRVGVCLILCDLDRFKVINDSRGHEVGDGLLADVAVRLREAVTAGHVARFGGDEFVIVLPDAERWAGVDQAERVLAAMRRPFAVGTDAVVVGVSVGVAWADPATPNSRSQLLRDADVAMYAAKRGGGNRIAVADDALRHEGGQQLDLELALRAALGSDQIRTWYQPLVDANGVIRALEALVRWQHPERGLLAPGAFLPAAKDAGLLAELSTAVLAHACDDVARWNRDRTAAGLAPVIVHVNCVEEQLIDSTFADVVSAHVIASGIDPRHLLLEISEETALERLPAGLPTLHMLRAAGVRFSLDDFGFGNSSLTMVRQVGDVAEIKIDKSIVDGIALDDAADLAVVRAVVGFCADQHITVVAEGIEHDEQWQVLRTLGVELFQGYLFHRPQPAERVEELLLGVGVAGSA